MNEWLEVYRLLSLPKCLSDMLPPIFPWSMRRTIGVGFPPAFVPFWCVDDGAYWGAWCHCLSKKRAVTFVEFSCRTEPRVTEIARTFEQLAALAALLEISSGTADEQVVARFALWAGLRDLPALYAASRSHEADWQRLKVHPSYRKELPLVCLPDGVGYDGDFPYLGMVMTAGTLREVSRIELDDRELQLARRVPGCPPWLSDEDGVRVADRLLSTGDNSGAWMALNATGVRYVGARALLREIATRAKSPLCLAIADAWCAAPMTRRGDSIP